MVNLNNINNFASKLAYQEEKGQNPYNVLIVLVVIVALILIGVFFFFTRESDTFFDIEGTLYLTLAVPNSEGIIADLYTLDVKERSLDKIKDDGFFRMTSALSPSGSAMAYIASPRVEGISDELKYEENLQLYIMDLETNSKRQITSDDSILKRLPEWSPDGTLITFVARDDYIADDFTPEGWDVYVADLEGNINRITKGLYPKWSPDGSHLLILRSDGLHLVTLSSGDDKVVWQNTGGDSTTSVHIDVSNDSTKLVLTNPSTQELFLVDITSWDPYVATITNTINEITSSWPTFSPGGKYVAVIEAGRINDVAIGPHVVVYDIETLKSKKLYKLNAFDTMFMLLSDWQ